MTTFAEANAGIDRLKKRILELEDALKMAIEIIGHPDDDGTKYLKSVLENS